MKFDSYHPILIFVYFVTALIGAVTIDHPVYLGISLVCAFFYSVKLGGMKIFLCNLGFLFLAVVYGAYYASYEHFGATVLGWNSIGNAITLEALLYGIVRGLKGAAFAMWCICVFRLVTTDKIIHLFGRISPKLSLFLSILLRMIPRVMVRAKRISVSRSGIGRGGSQGRIFERVKHWCSQMSILVTWTLEDFVESASSMKARGYSLKGRTAFSIYRFDQRDGCLLVTFLMCLSVLAWAVFNGETKIYFDPVIVMGEITIISYLCYVAYFVFLILPLVLQVVAVIYNDRAKRMV